MGQEKISKFWHKTELNAKNNKTVRPAPPTTPTHPLLPRVRLLLAAQAAERRGIQKEAVHINERVRQAVEEAVSLTMAKIKPALQNQESVERAIAAAEERAKEAERQRATQIQARCTPRCPAAPACRPAIWPRQWLCS